MHLKTAVIWLLAALLLGDSLWRAARSNFNLGVLMMYCITAAVWVYALFHRRIDAFCAAGAGRVLKYVFFAGCGLFAGLMVLVGVLGSVLFIALLLYRLKNGRRAVPIPRSGLSGCGVSMKLEGGGES